jgi:hypothetical protein
MNADTSTWLNQIAVCGLVVSARIRAFSVVLGCRSRPADFGIMQGAALLLYPPIGGYVTAIAHCIVGLAARYRSLSRKAISRFTSLHFAEQFVHENNARVGARLSPFRHHSSASPLSFGRHARHNASGERESSTESSIRLFSFNSFRTHILGKKPYPSPAFWNAIFAAMSGTKMHCGAYGVGVEYVYTMVHGAPATRFPEYVILAASTVGR